MKSVYTLVLFALLSLAQAAPAPLTDPVLGRRGSELLNERFDGAALPQGWNKNTGVVNVRDGVLHASELPADQHFGAFRKAIPLQDAVVQLDFRLEGVTAFHVGFDPAPGQLKKKGHLFSVIISGTGWSITEHNDKADPASKNKVHAKSGATFPGGQWHTLTIEMKGSEVVATVDGKESLRAKAADFAVKKPGLVFRVGGRAGQEVLVDNVRAWELK